MSSKLGIRGGDSAAMQKRIEIFRKTEEARSNNVLELVDYFESSASEKTRLEEENSQLREDLRIARSEPQTRGNGQEAAYVAVLIDGNEYSFNDAFVNNSLPGGIAAGEALRNAVAEHLNGSAWDGGDVYARVYADLARFGGMVSQRNTHNEDGKDLRAFCRGFNTSFRSFDFIDAGDGKDSSSNKITGALRLFVNDSNCKHIFVTATKDNASMGMLHQNHHKTPVTIIGSGHSGPHLQSLDMKVIEMLGVLQPGSSRMLGTMSSSQSTLDSDWNPPRMHGPRSSRNASTDVNATTNWCMPSAKPSASNSNHESDQQTASGWNSATDSNTSSDRANASEGRNSEAAWPPSPVSDLNDFHEAWREPSASASASTPYRLNMDRGRRGTVSSESASSRVSSAKGARSTPPLTPRPSDSISSNSSNAVARQQSARVPDHIKRQRMQRFKRPDEEIGVKSPTREECKYLIPVNKDGQRVDRPLHPPSRAAIEAFKDLSVRPCHHHHLRGYCEYQQKCEYGHAALDDDVRDAMLWDIRAQPCVLNSECRWNRCMRSHTCTDVGCATGRQTNCRQNVAAHKVDCRVSKWVKPVIPDPFNNLRPESAMSLWSDQGNTRARAVDDDDWTSPQVESMASFEESPFVDEPAWEREQSSDHQHEGHSSWTRPTAAHENTPSRPADPDDAAHVGSAFDRGSPSMSHAPEVHESTDLMSFTDVSGSEAETEPKRAKRVTKRSVAPSTNMRTSSNASLSSRKKSTASTSSSTGHGFSDGLTEIGKPFVLAPKRPKV